MSPFKRPERRNLGNEILGDFRNQLLFQFSAATLLVIIPFCINHFLQGRPALGLFTAIILVIAGIEILAIYRGKEPPVKPILAVILVLLALIATLQFLGYSAVLWFYPSIVVMYFLLPRRQAVVFSAILLIAAAAHSFVYVDAPTTVRVVASLALTMLFANVFLSVVMRLQESLRRQATIDPLTGTFNRRHLFESFTLISESHQRYGTASSVLLFDVDYFKRINDAHGHSVGDEVLSGICKLVLDLIRSIDSLCRIGGEEFVVLLPNTSLDAAMRVAEKLRAEVEKAKLPHGNTVTISVGVAQIRSAEDWDALFKRCDTALYQAKEDGRNRVVRAEHESQELHKTA